MLISILNMEGCIEDCVWNNVKSLIAEWLIPFSHFSHFIQLIKVNDCNQVHVNSCYVLALVILFMWKYCLGPAYPGKYAL